MSTERGNERLRIYPVEAILSETRLNAQDYAAKGGLRRYTGA